MKPNVCAICTAFLLPVSSSLVAATRPPWMVEGRRGVVASDSPHASRAGLEILQAGGNAVDAATAVSFALAVTRPYSTGLGGGGFLLARLPDGEIVVEDFRETAPSAAHADIYVQAARRDPHGPAPSLFGYLAVGVPGVVAGRCQALARYGTMPLARVLKPAIRLARDGYPVDRDYVKNTEDVLRRYEKYPTLRKSCGYVYRTHLRSGDLRSRGDTLVQPALARLLEGLAAGGEDFFYRGPVALSIAAVMKKQGGIITEKDLAAYQVRWREPLRTTYRDYEIIGMPPPSSGGVALAETLNILATFDLRAVSQRDAGLAMHYQIEAMKHAFADRARWLGDADFVKVPVELLTSTMYAARLAGRIRPTACGRIDAYGSKGWDGTAAPAPLNDSGTSHFCVVDRWGGVVVSTETINTTFGSLAAIDEWGLILNNEMDDFSAEPGRPNAFGLVQSARNKIEPGKRPLSSMAPTIVLRNGEPYLLLGASGGPRIISSVLNVLLGVTDFDRSLEQAMLSPRPHHQWRPEEVFFDAEPSKTVRLGLTRRGHVLSPKRRKGVVQAILRTKDGWLGASDPRKGGRPAGY